MSVERDLKTLHGSKHTYVIIINPVCCPNARLIDEIIRKKVLVGTYADFDDSDIFGGAAELRGLNHVYRVDAIGDRAERFGCLLECVLFADGCHPANPSLYRDGLAYRNLKWAY